MSGGMCRHDIGCLPAISYDTVYAGAVLYMLSQRIDGRIRQEHGLKGIDSDLRPSRSMSRSAEKLDLKRMTS